MKEYLKNKSSYFGIFFLFIFVLVTITPNVVESADAAIDSGKMIILKEDLPHNGDPLLNEEQIQECEEYHSDYTQLPEPEFNKKYLYHYFIGDCVLLYDDQIWQYNEDDRYDKLSFRLVELRENIDEKRTEQIGNMPELTTISVTESEIPETFLYVFEVCAKNDPIYASNILVASDQQLVSAIKFPDELIIESDSCEEFQVDIVATNSNLIRLHDLNKDRVVGLELIDTPEITMDVSNQIIPQKSPREQIKLGVDPMEIQCNSNFVLIMKNSDNSPACVSSATKIKLVDRGWAK